MRHPRPRRWRWAVAAAAVFAVAVAAELLLFAPGAPPPPTKEVRMPRSSTLVVYYSRTGTTAKLAHAIAEAAGADVERLEDTVDRRGALGLLRSLWDAFRRSDSLIEPLSVDPAQYRLVVVGTPDWGQSVAAPVRTFLKRYRGRLPPLAFFLTDGRQDHALVFLDMARLAGREPVATLGVPHDDVVPGRFEQAVADFVERLPATKAPRPVRALAPAPP